MYVAFILKKETLFYLRSIRVNFQTKYSTTLDNEAKW
jgi:hypothetical protein